VTFEITIFVICYHSIFKFTFKNRPLEQIINRGFYNRTQIVVKISCIKKGKFSLGWVLRLTECMDEFYIDTEKLPVDIFLKIYNQPNTTYHGVKVNKVKYQKQEEREFECESTDSEIELQYDHEPLILPDEQFKNVSKAVAEHHDHTHLYDTIGHTWQDGPYSFIIFTQPNNVLNPEYAIKVNVGFRYKNGYLSANDWPFLPFYATMCAIYSIYALFWLVVCLMYWRDLLRVKLIFL
jgi:hypothetical protein